MHNEELISEPISSDPQLAAYGVLLLFVCLPFEQDGPHQSSLSPRKSLTVAKTTPWHFRTGSEPREPGSCVGVARACAVPSTRTCPGHPEPLGLWEPRLPQLGQQRLLSCASTAGYSWYGVEKVAGARPVRGHTERLWESSSPNISPQRTVRPCGGMADFQAFRWDVASGCRERGNSIWKLGGPRHRGVSCISPARGLLYSYEAWARGPSRESLNAESRSPWRAPRVGSPASGPGPPGPCTGPALARQAVLQVFQGLQVPSVCRGWGSLKESYRQAPCGDQEPAWQSLCFSFSVFSVGRNTSLIVRYNLL